MRYLSQLPCLSWFTCRFILFSYLTYSHSVVGFERIIMDSLILQQRGLCPLAMVTDQQGSPGLGNTSFLAQIFLSVVSCFVFWLLEASHWPSSWDHWGEGPPEVRQQGIAPGLCPFHFLLPGGVGCVTFTYVDYVTIGHPAPIKLFSDLVAPLNLMIS